MHRYSGTLISTSVAARALGVSERTVQRWVRDGKLTNHGDARHVRLDLAEIARNTPSGRALRRLRDILTGVA